MSGPRAPDVRVLCARCDKAVDFFQLSLNPDRTAYRLSARCHGEVDRRTVSGAGLGDSWRDQPTITVFEMRPGQLGASLPIAARPRFFIECALCEKEVDVAGFETDVLRGEFIVTARCHGQTESIRVDKKALEDGQRPSVVVAFAGAARTPSVNVRVDVVPGGEAEAGRAVREAMAAFNVQREARFVAQLERRSEKPPAAAGGPVCEGVDAENRYDDWTSPKEAPPAYQPGRRALVLGPRKEKP